MCVSKAQHVTGRKTGFFRFFNFSTNITTGNRKNSEFVQPQPVVWSFAVGFSPISVFFPVQRTGPANTIHTHHASAHLQIFNIIHTCTMCCQNLHTSADTHPFISNHTPCILYHISKNLPAWKHTLLNVRYYSGTTCRIFTTHLETFGHEFSWFLSIPNAFIHIPEYFYCARMDMGNLGVTKSWRACWKVNETWCPTQVQGHHGQLNGSTNQLEHFSHPQTTDYLSCKLYRSYMTKCSTVFIHCTEYI